MKKNIYLMAIAAIMTLSAFTSYHSTSWKIADGYEIKFTSEDPSGIFKSLKGEIKFTKEHLDQSSFNMTIDVASINTGNGMKNQHAVSEHWFNAEQYPEISFKSNLISKTDYR